MDEMMIAITGSVIIKSALILAVLEAAQYFHNPRLLWWWVLVLFAEINYKRKITSNDNSEEEDSNES